MPKKRMKRIEIMGPGCRRCDETEKLVLSIVDQYKIVAAVEMVKDFDEMVKAGVFAIPAVVVDGQLMTVGRVPEIQELLDWLEVE